MSSPHTKVAGNELACVISEHLQQLEADWMNNGMWSSYATRLDNSDIFYVLPDEFQFLVSKTEFEPTHLDANCDGISMKILGRAKCSNETQMVCSFWSDDLVDDDTTLCLWAKALENDMSKSPERRQIWTQAYGDALAYFEKHRQLVRCAGQLLGIDMDNHDLTKTTIFHHALGYLFHWPEKEGQDDEMKALAWKIVRERHQNQEDHHPEYQGGSINAHKLFVDRISVGIQKNPMRDDNQRGWGIEAWIPQELRSEWDSFKQRNGHLDMNQILDMESVPLPDMTLML